MALRSMLERQGAGVSLARWSAPIAVAAGFVAVAGVVLVTRAPAADRWHRRSLAHADAGVARNAGAPVPARCRRHAESAEPQSVVGSGKLIRDARLERYLAAHKQFAGSSALGRAVGLPAQRDAPRPRTADAPCCFDPCLHSTLVWGLRSALTPGIVQRRKTSAVSLEPREVRAWLMRIHEAASQHNFQGTFVVSAGGTVSSARIAHYCDGRNQFERIESLDGKARTCSATTTWCTRCGRRASVALVEQRDLLSRFRRCCRAATTGSSTPTRCARKAATGSPATRPTCCCCGRAMRTASATVCGPNKNSGLLLRAEVLGERGEVLEIIGFLRCRHRRHGAARDPCCSR